MATYEVTVYPQTSSGESESVIILEGETMGKQLLNLNETSAWVGLR